VTNLSKGVHHIIETTMAMCENGGLTELASRWEAAAVAAVASTAAVAAVASTAEVVEVAAV
jgi:hypothetical protein